MKMIFWGLGALLAAATGAVACPDHGLPAVEAYQVTGPQMRQPKFYNVVAGGDFEVRECAHVAVQSDVGDGAFPDAPDFSFDTRDMAGLRLVVRVSSECDSALLVHSTTAGWSYDDDSNGRRDPKISLVNLVDGQIDVWIGTDDGAQCIAKLRMETFAR
jgi:hypothetical protein